MLTLGGLATTRAIAEAWITYEYTDDSIKYRLRQYMTTEKSDNMA